MNKIRRAIVNTVLKRILNVLCKIDSKEFKDVLTRMRVASQPLILAVNHINFLEVPILVAYSYPLLLTGLVKAETWKNPIMAFIFDTYEAIPIDRRGSIAQAFKGARDALSRGFFVCIAPEGTRSKTGVLGKGKAGVVQLSLDTGVAVLPVVHYGGENIWSNIKRFRRTPFRFKVGRPFRFKTDGRVDKAMREALLDELMGQMARLLPEDLRGGYAEQAQKQAQYLEFIDFPPDSD
ncbi:MAG: 1-acyl-sn-glycerol-3-phosphate acyltransferase [Treponema sp.]|jgi:1-acyl-sn-glycerol-3-phosphate acyltransferase|nr:1-acyl-sn-glycerol-3-phosphate acyltransferase [Treponema sp.]